MLIYESGSGSVQCRLETQERTPQVHFDTLPSRAFELKTILISSGSINEKLKNQGVCFVNLHYGSMLRQGYLVAYGDDTTYVLLSADEVSGDAHNRETVDPVCDPGAWEAPNGCEIPEHKDIPADFRGFMKPPANAIQTKSLLQSPINEKNPQIFLLGRYYSTLYQLKMPLSYFPKTTLPRLRNLCESSDLRVQTLLLMYLTADRFSQTQERFGAMTRASEVQPAHQVSEMELEYQRNFVSLYLSNTTEENAANTLLELKIREAQLQILLILELIVARKFDEAGFFAAQPFNREKKRFLVRKKGRKIMPTLLGLAVPTPVEELENTGSETEPSPNELRRSLFSLIDQIGLWDSLLGRKNGQDENTHGYLAQVIVPYFNKSLPVLVPAIIKAFKGLRPRLKAVKVKSSATNIPVEEVDSSSAAVPKKPKFSKQLLSADQISLLHRASSSDLRDLKPAFLLKRSKSNLGGSKDLKRRQVDMSVSKSELEDSKMQLFIFADARRIRLAVDAPNQMEVSATPAKAQRRPRPTTAQVMATPSNVRTVDIHAYVQETPVAAISLQEKLNRAQNDSRQTAIESSPMRPDSPVHKNLQVEPDQEVPPRDFLVNNYTQESPFSVAPTDAMQVKSPRKVISRNARRRKPTRPKLVRQARTANEPTNDPANEHVPKKSLTETAALIGNIVLSEERHKLSSPKSSELADIAQLEFSGHTSLSRQDTVKLDRQSADSSVQETNSENSILEKPAFQNSAWNMKLVDLEKSESGSFDSPGMKPTLPNQQWSEEKLIAETLEDGFKETRDSGSDSDYERLLAVSKPVVRKYTKRR